MEDRENDDEDEVLKENGNFVNAVLRKWDAESFLKSSEMVYGRSVAFEPAAQDVFLQYSTFAKGVTSLNSFSCMWTHLTGNLILGCIQFLGVLRAV